MLLFHVHLALTRMPLASPLVRTAQPDIIAQKREWTTFQPTSVQQVIIVPKTQQITETICAHLAIIVPSKAVCKQNVTLEATVLPTGLVLFQVPVLQGSFAQEKLSDLIPDLLPPMEDTFALQGTSVRLEIQPSNPVPLELTTRKKELTPKLLSA